MRWPIRTQIFVPFAVLLLTAVASTAITAAWLGVRRSAQERIGQLRSVVETLGGASFPYTDNVLQEMRGLSGADFVVVDREGAVVGSTFLYPIHSEDLPANVPLADTFSRVDQSPSVKVGNRRYFTAAVRRRGTSNAATLYIFYPEEDWEQARWQAAWPPLATGSVAMLLVLVISAWLAHRLAGRIGAVRSLFAEIAQGRFDHAAAVGPCDEVYDLITSANQLSDQLATMRDQIGRTERLRLLAQLAGGLAHQLRNAVTGARMAVQLHQRRCSRKNGDETLDVALRQLALTEERVKSLLSLGAPRHGSTAPGNLEEILDDAVRLVEPACRHAHVEFQHDSCPAGANVLVSDAGEVKAAVLNLLLNAIEAAGVGGAVQLRLEREDDLVRLRIVDTGPGPPKGIEPILCEPFVTSKPEGVGLGLALARQAARNHGGELNWKREHGRTVFTMSFSATSPALKSAPKEEVEAL